MSFRKEKKLDKEKFIVNFKAIYTCSLLNTNFSNFLASEFNVEPLNFLWDVKKIETMQNIAEIIVHIQKILDTYIVHNSPCEINISGKSKIDILELFSSQTSTTQWTLSKSPNELFVPLVKIVHAEMYHDSWKRFVRSPLVDEIIMKFHDDPTVCQLQISQNFPYDDEYFTHHDIEDRDFDYSKGILNDNSSWEVTSI
jgi:hypothetical protein